MKPVIWLIILFSPSLVFSQSTDEEKPLSKIYVDRGYDLMRSDPDSARYFLNQAISQANKEKNEDELFDAIMGKTILFDNTGQADSSKYYYEWLISRASSNNASAHKKARIFYRISFYFDRANEFIQALNVLDSAASYALKLNDSTFYADIINKRGAVNEDMGRRSVALELYLEAMGIYYRYNDEETYGITINNIAISYKKAGDLKNAMTYYNKSIELAREQGDAGSEAVTRINRGLLYKDLGQLENALIDLHFSLNNFTNDHFIYGIAVCQHNLGEVQLVNNHIDSALFYLNKSQEIAVEFEFMELLIKNNLALAKIARKKNDYVTSNQFALKAYQYADEKDAKEDIRDISIMLSNNYEDLGDFKNALEYHKIFKSVEDTIYNRESQFKLNILRTEYDLEYRDNEIEALQAKNKLQNNLAKAQKNQNILLIIGFLSSIVFFIILFILYRKQRSFSVKLTRQKDLLIEQKEEIETAQEQIVNQNETLHHLNKEKDNLIAMVAHDLRSPLNQIRGVLGLVKMEQNNDSIGQLIDIANQSSEVLSERINRILDIEAINAGKINLKTEHLNVKKVLGSLHQNIHGTAVQKQMNLIIDPHADISCLADENYLLQVLENLCTNAIKFSPENSEIKISVTEVEKNVLFAVKDQGPGISEVDKINLFLPYSKTSNKPTGDETSTGLGLAIVKKYVEAMAGEVWVESEGNTGSVFYVKLPKAA